MEPQSFPWTWMIQKWKKDETRKWAYPLAKICAKIALWQRNKGRYYVIRTPAESKFWNLKPIRWLTNNLKVNWTDYQRPSKDKPSTNVPTFLAHNLPEKVFAPLSKMHPQKWSRERRTRAMENLMADCIMAMFPDAVEDRQCYLVGDLFDLLQGTPRELSLIHI